MQTQPTRRTAASIATAIVATTGIIYTNPKQFAQDLVHLLDSDGFSTSIMQIGKTADPAISIDLNNVSGRIIPKSTIRGLNGIYIDPINSDMVYLRASNDVLAAVLVKVTTLSGRNLAQAVSQLDEMLYDLIATKLDTNSSSINGAVTRWIGLTKKDEVKLSSKMFEYATKVMSTPNVAIGDKQGFMMESTDTGHIAIMISGKLTYAVSGYGEDNKMTLRSLSVSRGDDNHPVFSYADQTQVLTIDKTHEIRAALKLVRNLEATPFSIQGQPVAEFAHQRTGTDD